MSDAKTAAEIEDILSSIRRLVSQDRKQAAAQRPQILSRLVVEDRLILTPAQRVKPEASRPSATVTPLKRPDPAQSWPEKTAAADEAALTLPEAQAAQPPLAEETAPRTEPLGRLHLRPAAAPDAGAASLGSSAPVAPAAVAADTRAPDTLAWEAEMGDAAPDLASLDWSSFTFARRPMAETYAARSRAAERLTAGHLSAPTASATISPEHTKAAPEPRPQLHTRAEAPVSEAAAPKIPAPETPAPESSMVTDLAAAPSAAEEAEPVEPILQEEDSIFSEEVLRELVRDLIREQLQGDLGERITRNIRKLVKAEIARAISVQSLE